MKTPNYLALVYDLQSLNDISRSDLSLNSVTVITPLKLFQESPPSFLGFKKSIPIRNYLNSAHVESIVVSLHQEHPWDRIIALHEVDILRAGILRDHLKIPGQGLESARAFRQKTLMKQILRDKNIPVPQFISIDSPLATLKFVDHHTYPVILKPDLGTGSRGVHVISSKRQLLSLWKKNNLFLTNQFMDWQMEEYIEGEMFHINGLVIDHELVACWPSWYPNQSIEMTRGKFASSVLLSPENPLTQPLNEYTKKVLNVLPTPQHTAFHLEVFVSRNNEIIFCEIASRIGGKGVRNSWLESFNIDLGKYFVESQVYGENYRFPKRSALQPSVLSGEIWFPSRQGILKSIPTTCPYPWVKEYQIFFKAGQRISKTQDINGCIGGTPLFTGTSDAEMLDRLNLFSQWFESQTLWQ